MRLRSGSAAQGMAHASDITLAVAELIGNFLFNQRRSTELPRPPGDGRSPTALVALVQIADPSVAGQSMLAFLMGTFSPGLRQRIGAG